MSETQAVLIPETQDLNPPSFHDAPLGTIDQDSHVLVERKRYEKELAAYRTKRDKLATKSQVPSTKKQLRLERKAIEHFEAAFVDLLMLRAQAGGLQDSTRRRFRLVVESSEIDCDP